jgi:nucleotide-binding universal stress UspA family protein
MGTPNFKHILVATDFSEHAAHAFDVAIGIARKLDARVTLMHAYYLPPVAYDGGLTWPIEDLSSLAKKDFERVVSEAKQAFPQLESTFESGYPSETIIATAERVGADMIVIGTHGRRGLPRMLLGSVAEKVVRTSPLPVLTISFEPQAAKAAASGTKR